MGFGAGFQGTVHALMPRAEPRERAGLLSSIYVVAYVSNSIPALIAGYMVGQVGLASATRVYGGLVICLAAAAFIGLLLRRDRSAPNRPISDAGILVGRSPTSKSGSSPPDRLRERRTRVCNLEAVLPPKLPSES